MVAPLQNPPLWPYTTFFAIPHACHGNFQKCPTRSYGLWEMVINEFDPREEPGKDLEEQISGRTTGWQMLRFGFRLLTGSVESG
jgi:hypothetical protein